MWIYILQLSVDTNNLIKLENQVQLQNQDLHTVFCPVVLEEWFLFFYALGGFVFVCVCVAIFLFGWLVFDFFLDRFFSALAVLELSL